MSQDRPEPTVQDVSDWWSTSVSRIEPNLIELRGRPVQDLIGSISFAGIIWLMLRGETATPGQERLLEAALVSSVDHGPHAPSIAVARMAATCGIGLNNAVATGVNLLGDVHGGAGEQCMALLADVHRLHQQGEALATAATATVSAWQAHSKYLPGFGHRFHSVDPRRDPLLGLVEEAVAEGRTRPVPINIDGCTAVVYAELGFPPPLARGLFVLSRSVGILAHAWEETGQGRRNKGPMPPSILPTFTDGA
jgi:citrate synthase